MEPIKSMEKLTEAVLQEVSLRIIQNPGDICCLCGKAMVIPPDSPIRSENSSAWKCKVCLDEIEAKRKEKERADLEERKQRLLSQMPLSFQRTERDKLPDPSKLDAALRWSFGAKGLLLYGPTGCGKSRVIWEVARREIFQGRRIRHVSAYELTRYPAMFMAGDDSAGRFAGSLVTAELVLLDDVFKAKPTERVEELLFAVIDERGAWDRPCLITLNDTGASLEGRLSADRGPALIRRLREYCQAIQFA